MVRIHPDRSFENPVELGMVPGSDWWMIAEQGGKIWTFSEAPNLTQTNTLAVNLRPHHQPFDNILGFTFHPRFATNRFIFINYNEPGNRTNGAIVSRFQVRPTTPPTIDLASEQVIIRWLGGGHNGCTLAFGNDGFLYISTGDATNPDPPDLPHRTGQDISDLLSSVLRIDVDRPSGTNAYSIPADNPFRNEPGARPEVWAFGFRNPWRMSFDRRTGDLWLGDVGFEQWEMIYRVRSGGNYGWSLVEGPNREVRKDVTKGPGPILPPLISLPHHEAASITGGLVYRGKKFPALSGAYIYGDWETGKFWAARNQGETLLSNLELCDTTLKPVSFAIDRNGELVILDYQGGLYTIEENPARESNQAFPRKLSQTGIFTELTSLKPSPGVAPYRPAGQMWNDYARAVFHLGIPGAEKISTADGRQTIAGRMWDFPSNTVFSRTLFLAFDQSQPESERKIETQLIHFDGQSWNPYTFRWNETQTDAELVAAEGTNSVFVLTNTPVRGLSAELPWRFYGRTECLRCHNAWAGETLSFNWFQLEYGKKSKGSSESDRLAALGLLEIKNRPDQVPALVDPRLADAPLETRARSWLHLNCSACHRNGAGGNVPAHLNIDQGLQQTRALNTVPTRGDFGIDQAKVISPGAATHSALFYRISTEGAGHMPLIGSRLVDEEGIGIIHDWIRSLPGGSFSNSPLLGKSPSEPAVVGE